MKCQKCKTNKELEEFVKDSSKALGYRPTCKCCRNEYLKDWRLNNKEEVRLSQQKWIENNPDKRKKSWTKYNRNNKELINSKNKLIRSDKPIYRAWKKSYYNRNKDKWNCWCQKRRALKLNTQVEDITEEHIRDLLFKQGFKCAISGEDLKLTGYHIDHIIPLSKGGTHTLDNVQLLTPTMNLRKGDRIWKSN